MTGSEPHGTVTTVARHLGKILFVRVGKEPGPGSGQIDLRRRRRPSALRVRTEPCRRWTGSEAGACVASAAAVRWRHQANDAGSLTSPTRGLLPGTPGRPPRSRTEPRTSIRSATPRQRAARSASPQDEGRLAHHRPSWFAQGRGTRPAAAAQRRRTSHPVRCRPGHLHAFRKTVATRPKRPVHSARQVADQLGHANPSMTLVHRIGPRLVCAVRLLCAGPNGLACSEKC